MPQNKSQPPNEKWDCFGWAGWWQNVQHVWKQPGMKGTVTIVIFGALVAGFFIGRGTAPQVIINNPSNANSVSQSVRQYPWIDLHLSYGASGTADKENKTIIDQLSIGFEFANTGSLEALDLNGAVEIAGRKVKISEWPTSLPPTRWGTMPVEYKGKEAASMDEAITVEKGTIRCSLTFSDLSGHDYEMDYEWVGQGANKNPRDLAVKLRGEYLKLKRP